MPIKALMARRISRWIAGGALLLIIIAGAVFVIPIHAQTTGGRVTLPGHLVKALKNVHAQGNKPGTDRLQINVALNLRDSAGLKALIAAQNDRHSPLYHQYLTPDEFVQRFAPSQATVNTVAAFLRSQGLHVSSVSPNRTIIHADAPVSVIEQAFQTHLSDFTFEGRAVYAPTAEPSVPDTLAGMILSVDGLNNVVVYHPMGLAPVIKSHAINPHGGSGIYGSYTPSDLRTAYDMNSLTASYTGTGQTVGIFELDGYLPSDINQYLSTFGLGSPKYSDVLVDGQPNTPGPGAIEVELDMEVVSAIAPGANQKIYIGPNTWAGIYDTYNQMVTDNVAKVISSSWGSCEAQTPTSYLQSLDNVFAQGASQGQAFFAASGDFGAYDCGDTNLGVDSPADDPYVVGVGGTNLQTDGSQNYLSESVWSCSTCVAQPPDTIPAKGLGGGGGLSSYFVMPNYQAGLNVINQFSNGHRQVPDVSANADPNTGYEVYCTVVTTGCSPSAPWVVYGGTSAAAPLWAGIATDINQYLAAQGKPTLGNALPILYQLFNTPQTYTPYHDVTSGNNLYFPAAAGYDLASGIGTPDVWNLARDAVANSPARSVSTTWYFGEGYTGTGFSEFLTLANPNSGPATVQVKYLLDVGSPVTKSYTVAATSRYTVYVNGEVPAGVGVSMVVTANLPIVAERPMYFFYTGHPNLSIPGGTDVLGATALGTQFDFGYLDTTNAGRAVHDTFLTILNQQTSAMTVTINYYPAAGGAAITRTHSVPASSRGTVFVGSEGLPAGQYGALVTLSAPGLVERPMYLVDGVTGYTGSADVVGVPNLLTNWYFAEGYTGSSGNTFSERYILFNPNSTTATATVKFLKSDGTTVAVPVTLAAGAQQVVDANSALGGAGVNNSATVTASQPILAERFMSFSYLGTIPGATDVIGAPAPGYLSYFAEGYSGTGFSEFLTLENPDTTTTAYVLVKYLPSNGATPTLQIYAVAPHSRYTVYTNAVMPGQSFSMVVQSGMPIVAERPMYFNYNSSGQTGGTDVVGYQP